MFYIDFIHHVSGLTIKSSEWTRIASSGNEMRALKLLLHDRQQARDHLRTPLMMEYHMWSKRCLVLLRRQHQRVSPRRYILQKEDELASRLQAEMDV